MIITDFEKEISEMRDIFFDAIDNSNHIPNWFSFSFGEVNSTDEDEKTVLTVPVRIDLLSVYRSL